MSVFIQAARVLFLAAICGGAAFADMNPDRLSVAAEPIGSDARDVHLMPHGQADELTGRQLGVLTPNQTDHGADSSPVTGSPDLSTTIVPTGEISAKWIELQSRIVADMETLAACRLDEDTCSQAARRFLSIVEIGRKHDRRARLGWINRAVNLSIRPMSDWAQYGYADFWASPLQTLGSGAGDCEDYAIVKYVVLRELGVASDDLRLVIVQDGKRRTEHAVVSVRYAHEWLILDNRTMAILRLTEARSYHPLFMLGQQDTREIATAATDRIVDR